jgi:hypothetical protein
VLAAGLLAAAALPAGASATTLRHAGSGFRVDAPAASHLRVQRGVYVFTAAGATISYSRSVSGLTVRQFGDALLRQLQGTPVSRSRGARRYTAEVLVGGRREAFVVTRSGSTVAVTTGTSTASRPLALATLRAIAASARGGYALRPPKAATAKPLALRSYRAPDGGATAQVPAGSGWNVQSSQGALQVVGAKGSLLLGYSINIFLPSSIPPGTSAGPALVSPYLSAAAALTGFWPRLADGVTNIVVRRLVRDGPLPSFTSSGLFQIDYRYRGRPWTGIALVGTDDPQKYSNFVWNLYFSGIGVPAGSTSAVGDALLRTWRSWDPSGAIAARTAQARQLIAETNEVWQQTSEFRSQTASRQARDVGCLLSGYYHVEDNSRRYDLPPLPCGQIYTKG